MKVRRWVNRRRKVVWSEPELPRFVKINPLSPPGAAAGLQPGDLSMARVAEEFLATEEDNTDIELTAGPYPGARDLSDHSA